MHSLQTIKRINANQRLYELQYAVGEAVVIEDSMSGEVLQQDTVMTNDPKSKVLVTSGGYQFHKSNGSCLNVPGVTIRAIGKYAPVKDRIAAPVSQADVYMKGRQSGKRMLTADMGHRA